MNPLRLFALSMCATALLSAAPRAADACSGPVCYGRSIYLLPTGAGASVPANAPALAVFTGLTAAAPTATLEKLTASGREAVPVGRGTAAGRPDVLLPSGLEAGASYELTVTSAASEGSCVSTVKAAFTAAPAAPKPTTLGTLRVTASGVTSLRLGSGASCSASASAAHAAFEVALPAEVAPWGALLAYETFVDGERWSASNDATQQVHHGGSWVGIGKDVVYAVCDENTAATYRGVSAGRHQVVMRARLAGEPSLALESAPLTIDLACPGSADAGSPDAGGGPSAAASDLGGAGCSAAAGPAGGAPLAATALAVLGLAALHRRRRR